MQSPHVLIPTLFAMASAVVSNATVAKPADGSFKRYDQGKGPALKQGLLTLSRRDRDASDP